MSQELNQVRINKITKALYDTNVANGTITPTMQEQEIWIFTDDNVYTSDEKTKLNGIETGAQKNPTKLSELSNDVNFVTKAVNDLTNYYLNTDTYSKTEVNELINGITTLNVSVVTALPTSNISNKTIYLVPKSKTETNNIYDEYLYVNNKWEKIGDTSIDLTNYALKSEIPTVTNDLTNTLKSHYDTAYTHSQQAHAPSNAQANKLESIKVNGVAQTITNKEVNITVPTVKTIIW